MANLTKKKEMKFKRKNNSVNKPVSETRTQPSSSINASDDNRVLLVVDGDGGGLDHNDVNTLYILRP